MNTIFRILRTIIYAGLFLYFFYWLALESQRFDRFFPIQFPPWAYPLGIFIMILSSLLALSCVLIFIFRGKGTPAIIDPPQIFVALGPYKYVRNPMYIGGLSTLLGFGVFQHSPSIILFTMILGFLFHLFVLFYEEPNLEKRFGQSYISYKLSTHRWLPTFK